VRRLPLFAPLPIAVQEKTPHGERVRGEPVTVLVLDREEFLAGVAGHPRSAAEADTVVRHRLD
jgi:hypothetical protein